MTQEKPLDSERGPWLFGGIRPINCAGALRDALAGFTLAAMNVPQVLGYTRIAGTPVVTGLYTLLLPLVAFAALGSSRYLVVAADSATAAILAGTLSLMAPVASAHYVALAGMVALMTAGYLVLARLFELGFLADFLSQTVLVGFLTGVGFQVGIAMLGEMLGVPVNSNRTIEQLAQVVHGLPQLHVPTLCLAGAVVAIVLVLRRIAPQLPGPLFAVIGAIAASAAFDFSGHGISVIQGVTGGLPPIGLPDVSWAEIPPLLRVAGSCFLMIVAQSTATARAYASHHRQALDGNTDLVGLAAANAAAALSGTFVVNGSPTQTAMVESSGGRSQIAHLATAAVVVFVLLFLTGPLHYLPRSVLGAHRFHDRRRPRRRARLARHPAREPRGVPSGADHRRGGGADRRRAGHPAGDRAVVAAARAPQLSTAHGRAGRGQRAMAPDSGGPRRAERSQPGDLSIRRRPLLCQCRSLRDGRARPRRRSSHAGELAGGRCGRDHQRRLFGRTRVAGPAAGPNPARYSDDARTPGIVAAGRS